MKVLAGVGSSTFVEVGIVLVIAVAFGLGLIVFLGWWSTHKMLRGERKEDEREARKRR